MPEEQNQTQNSEQDNLEQRVRNMLGDPPREPNVPALPPKPTESPPSTPAPAANRLIDDSPDVAPSLPSVGSTIEPMSSPATNTEAPATEAEDTVSAVPTPAPTESNNAITPLANKKSGKLRRFFKAWLGTSKKRWTTFASATGIMLLLIVIPNTRYFILNSFGARSSASVTVLDESTSLPLRNVEVKLANASGMTNGDGQVTLEHIKLGRTNLVIQKRAFATINQPITLGWGSNPLGKFNIKPVGDQYAFLVKDWLTEKPITKAEAYTDSGASAFSDDQGKILLTIDSGEVTDNMTITVKATGYRNEPVKLDTTSKAEQPVNLVVDKKHLFMSNRSGNYDLYSIDIDGQNEKLLLAGTGLERDDLALVPHPNDNIAALVSTRVNVRNNDGYLLSTLTVINTVDKLTSKVAQSEKIQIIGWVGSRLIYAKVAEGASAADSNRFRLMSYDYKTTESVELAKANAFNDVVMVGDTIYYATSTGDASGSKLVQSNGTGNLQNTILDKEVWNIFRTSFDTLDLAVGTSWYEYKIGNSNAVKLTESPANPQTRIYINSPDNNHSLWVDQRDGKGVLISYDIKAKQDDVLISKTGITYPIRWLNNSTVIYRIKTESETADFVMSLDGGTPHKIKDVANYSGINKWYFY